MSMQQKSLGIFLKSLKLECLQHWRYLLRHICEQTVDTKDTQEVKFEECSR